MKIEDRVVVVLTVDRLFDDNVAFDEDLSLLMSIASIIEQAIKIYTIVIKTREDLAIENKRLNQELEMLKMSLGKNQKESHISLKTQVSVEDVLEKKFDEIITVMDGGERRLYADVISKVEKSLFKLALKRNKNVKCEAARFLGINRNTFHKKMKGMNLSS